MKTKIAKTSPYGLIQEDLAHNEWLFLVACILLNRTSRKQLDRVFGAFVSTVISAKDFLETPENVVKDIIRPLGFVNRRYELLKKMSEEYENGTEISELSGVGRYAHDSHRIFLKGSVGTERPSDHALSTYWTWLKDSYQRC